LNRLTLARTGSIQPGFSFLVLRTGTEKAMLYRKDSIDPVTGLSMLEEAQRELGIGSD
jgi:hypothetical protein